MMSRRKDRKLDPERRKRLAKTRLRHAMVAALEAGVPYGETMQVTVNAYHDFCWLKHEEGKDQ